MNDFNTKLDSMLKCEAQRMSREDYDDLISSMETMKMYKRVMVSLDAETLEMKNNLMAIDGFNLSFLVRKAIRAEYKKVETIGA